jgi:cytochrome c peroxidase
MVRRSDMIRTGVAAFAVASALLWAGCRRDPGFAMPAVDPLELPIRPAHFPPARYTFSGNPYSKTGFELGRRLFGDPLLSVDGTVSCASCHRQQGAFSDPGRAFSVGVGGRSGVRNSPPVFNMAWNTSFMWDGGINHIEVMPFAPITDPLEMADDLVNVLAKLNAHTDYPRLFREVFQRTPIDDQQLFHALAQYMGNLVSAGSSYDRYLLGEASLSAQAAHGLSLFRSHCSRCHVEPLLTDQGFHNNGLDSLFTDPGRYRITQDPIDLGRFKTPSLRNVALTPPYMHDGRFATLEQVVEHYSTGLVHSATLDPGLAAHGPGIGLDATDRAALVAFLHTLTDHTFITDPALAP